MAPYLLSKPTLAYGSPDRLLPSVCTPHCPSSVLQIAAQRLAVCNDIGEAAYLDSLVAAAFIVRCKLLPSGPALMKVLLTRYGVDPEV